MRKFQRSFVQEIVALGRIQQHLQRKQIILNQPLELGDYVAALVGYAHAHHVALELTAPRHSPWN